jgi:hypothetical protein
VEYTFYALYDKESYTINFVDDVTSIEINKFNVSLTAQYGDNMPIPADVPARLKEEG